MEHQFIQQAVHGYQRGHQMLACSTVLTDVDSDELSRLSDLSGSPVGRRFDPYLTVFPLPSGDWHCVARTWQDLEAPRQGCVLTHSILIPRGVWQIHADIRRLVAFLRRPSRDTIESFRKPLVLDGAAKPSNHWSYDASNHNRQDLDDFASRYFAKDIDPVVWPSSSPDEAEQIIVGTAQFLWPHSRTTFSACSYCLQPRSTKESYFQVMFAPRKAIGRFSAFDERHIVGRSVSSDISTAQESDALRLLSDSLLLRESHLSHLVHELGDFLSGRRSEVMRVIKLSELTKNEDFSATRHLAILDLWGAIAPSSSTARPLKMNAFEQAISATERLPVEDRPQFLVSLAQRLRRPAMGGIRGAREDLHKAMQKAVASAPTDTSRVLDRLERIPRELIASVGSFLAEENLRDSPELERAVWGLSARDGALLLAYEPVLSRKLLSGPDTNKDAAKRVLAWANTAPSTGQNHIVEELLCYPKLYKNEELLSFVNQRLSPGQVGVFLNAVRSGTDKDRSPLAELQRTAERHPIETLKYFVSTDGISSNDDALIASRAINSTNEIFDLIEASPNADNSVLVSFLSEVLDYLDLSVLDPDRMAETLEIMSKCPHEHGDFVADLVRAVPSNLVPLPKKIHRDFGDARSAARERLMNDRVESVVAGRLTIEEFKFECSQLAQPANRRSDFWNVLGMGILHSASSNPGTAWHMLDAAWQTVPPEELPVALNVIEQLYFKSEAAFDEPMAEHWAQIIRASLSTPQRLGPDLALWSLQMAMRHQMQPFGTIVAESFATFYKGLPEPRRSNRLLDPLGIFDEVDKKKGARSDLISRFLASNWRPGFLAQTASKSSILKKIVKELIARREQSYLASMVKDLEIQGRKDLREQINRLLAKR